MVSKVSSKSASHKPKKTQKAQTQQKTQEKTQQKTQNTQEAKKADETKKSDDLSDRQKSIRNEINTNKDLETGESKVSPQNGDKLGDVVNAQLDKDGDGKLNDTEKANKNECMNQIFQANPDLAQKAADTLGIDAKDLDVSKLSPEQLQKLDDMGLDVGKEIKIPGEKGAEEAKSPEEAAAGEEAKGEEAAKGGGASPPKGEEAKGEEAAKGGGEGGGGAPQGAGGPQAAQGAQQAKGEQQTVEGMIAKAAQLIQQASGGGGQAAQPQAQPAQAAQSPFGSVMAQATQAMGTNNGAGAAGAGAAGGNPQQLAQEAKGLLQKAKGMIDKAGGAQTQQQQPQAQPQQNAQANPFGQAMPAAQNNQQVDMSKLDEKSLQQMPNEAKLQIIQQLDAKADKIIQGGGQQNPMNAMNQLAQSLFNGNQTGQNAMLAQNLIRPNIGGFMAA